MTPAARASQLMNSRRSSSKLHLRVLLRVDAEVFNPADATFCNVTMASRHLAIAESLAPRQPREKLGMGAYIQRNQFASRLKSSCANPSDLFVCPLATRKLLKKIGPSVTQEWYSPFSPQGSTMTKERISRTKS
jgi:hypothetical protein